MLILYYKYTLEIIFEITVIIITKTSYFHYYTNYSFIYLPYSEIGSFQWNPNTNFSSDMTEWVKWKSLFVVVIKPSMFLISLTTIHLSWSLLVFADWTSPENHFVLLQTLIQSNLFPSFSWKLISAFISTISVLLFTLVY